MGIDVSLDTPLVATPAWLDRLAVVGGRHDWTWRQLHAASVALAARLPDGATVVNLCNSRAGFLVAWLAALRRGCLQQLPPSSGAAELAAMLAADGEPIVVTDDADALQLPGSDPARCLVFEPRPVAGVPDAALAWSPDFEAPRVELYTSGSTGRPEPQVKTLGQLVRGAQRLGERLATEVDGDWAALRAIVCSVPSQHMFGLETSVLLPLVYGVALLDGRPLLPADVRAAFGRCDGAACWVATPLHLRAQVQSGEVLARCHFVIASTMPLAPALAGEAERLCGAPVLEIYGSTETGAVAMRRTARDASWRPLPGVCIEPSGEGAIVRGAHFRSPQTLADQVEDDGRGGFRLLGRSGDLIKIAGRRASLAGLNLLLQDLPGLTDGVFYLPATGAPGERLILIHAGAPLDRAQAEAWLRARIDPVFLPRAIIRVDDLPRAAHGKLPRHALDAIYDAWRSRRAAR
ncbi:MAG TPA: AMP-binding protein [Methylibium sp.]|nr:AMP-binding protein [Methylibium sp.]